MQIQAMIPRVPGLSYVVNRCASAALFPGSQDYWERRYSRGRNSGDGSYGRLAEFKAEVLNDFVRRNKVHSVIEFGFGDGHQLALADYPQYIGLDVSPTAAAICQRRFDADASKSFFAYDPETFVDNAGIFRADLALSLDVVYHLVEQDVFERYMQHLFASAQRYVIVYSSNEEALPPSPHVRHRAFCEWVAQHQPEWRLQQHVPNRYPFDPKNPSQTSFADFFVFERNV